MQFDPRASDRLDEYDLFTRCVIPRPIAWVSTVSAAGVANLAPFSFFGAVCGEPPGVVLGVGRRHGVPKDTAQNLLGNGEAVVHVPHRPLVEAMVKTSADVVPEVDEFDLAGLAKAPSVKVRPPRVAQAAIALECRMVHHFELGEGPTDVFFLEVLCYHVADELLDARGLPDAGKIAAVGRLGNDEYCQLGEVFSLARPRP